MATPMRATTSFAVGYRVVREGDIVNSDDPITSKCAIYFEPVTTPDVVEQATAAPGERRRLPHRPRRSTTRG